MNKFIFLFVLFLISKSLHAVWYYRCEGKVTWPHFYQGGQCAPATFLDAEGLKKASTLNYSYVFSYVGKKDNHQGKKIEVSGICEGWDSSNICSYAVGSDGKDLVCNRENMGKYVATSR